ncbi:MAG: AN1-type zinc finger domain-containing protein [Promethearchaeota archaeon]
MNLNSKYITGFIIVVATGIGLFSPIGFLIGYMILGEDAFIALPYLVLGIISTMIGIIFINSLFSPERIRGYKAEYEVSPDLTHFEVVKTYPDSGPKHPKVPEVAYCSACGKKVFKPFQCSRCGQILCGSHFLAGSHICKDEI